MAEEWWMVHLCSLFCPVRSGKKSPIPVRSGPKETMATRWATWADCLPPRRWIPHIMFAVGASGFIGLSCFAMRAGVCLGMWRLLVCDSVSP